MFSGLFLCHDGPSFWLGVVKTLDLGLAWLNVTTLTQFAVPLVLHSFYPVDTGHQASSIPFHCQQL